MVLSRYKGNCHRMGNKRTCLTYQLFKKLNKLFARRQIGCKKLENAETELLRKATKAWRSRQSKVTTDEEMQDNFNGRSTPPEASHEFLRELVPDNQRPKHRSGLFSRFGTKVDTVEYYKVVPFLSSVFLLSLRHATRVKFLA
jgi:hypothetical protein